MAMTFTLVSHLRDQLSTLVRTREELRIKRELEEERRVLEVSLSNSPPKLISVYAGRGNAYSRNPSNIGLV